MKILLCHNFYQEPGGEDHSFAAQKRLLEQNGNEVLVYTRDNRDIDTMRRYDVALRTLWNPRTYREVAALVRRERADVVHCTNTFPLISPAVYAAARRNGAAVVQGLHNFRLVCLQSGFLRDGEACELCAHTSLPWPAVRHACYRGDRAASAVGAAMLAVHRAARTWSTMVDAYLAPSDTVRRTLAAAGLPQERIHVVPNFLAEDPGVGPGGGGYVVFVGRLAPEKGIDTLLEAWRALPEPVLLKIAGDGPLAPAVRRAAAADRRIEWLGHRPPQEVLDLIGAAECLLIPSTFHEAFGRVIIEAYAKGTAIIGSRRGAIGELVEDGVTGFLCEPGSSADLLRNLRLLLGGGSRRDELRRACRRRFEERYLGARCYQGLMETYRSARQRAAP